MNDGTLTNTSKAKDRNSYLSLNNGTLTDGSKATNRNSYLSLNDGTLTDTSKAKDRNSYLSLNDGTLKQVSDEGNVGDNKDGYDDIPDHDYEEMNENQQKPDERPLLLEAAIKIIPDNQLNSSVHRQSTTIDDKKRTSVISQQEVESTEYVSVTADMFVPPHKRT